jgi:BirA family transcriptional regulator, biotin operon repressor / biotin---[acetyl-CoA-carboxylase] ligase
MSAAQPGAAPPASPRASRSEEIAALALPPFFRLLTHAALPSTSDEAKRLAENDAPAGTLVWALEQSAGRGRQGRSWVSPPGNLYVSLILRPAVAVAVAAQLGFVASLAVADACAEAAPGAALACKWPNDVLLAGKKLAGILLESQARPDGQLDWLVLGIGINLAHHPEGTDFPATSLAASGVDIAADVALACLGKRFVEWYERWQEGAGFAAIRAAWLGRAHRIGQPIRVRLINAALAGRFAGLDEDGALLLETEAGRRRIASGEVFPAAP